MSIKEIAKKISKLNPKKCVIVWDTETTGLSDTDEIIQLGAVKINDKGIVEELNISFCPNCEVNPQASKVNGKTKESLKNEKNFKELAPKINDFFKDAQILGGYNTKKFDNRFLERQMKEAGYPDILKDKKHFDAYQIYKTHRRHSLADSYEWYCKKDIKNAHDALGDVIATIEVILAQAIKEDKTLEQVCDLYNNDEDFQKFIIKNERDEDVFNFSKNKGQCIRLADKGFLEWILKQSFIPASVKNYIKDKYLK